VLDALAARLTRGVGQGVTQRQQRLRDLARALPRVETLVATPRQRLDAASMRLSAALGLAVAKKRGVFDRLGGRMQPAVLRAAVVRQRDILGAQGDRLQRAVHLRLDRLAERQLGLAARLAPALARMLAEAGRKTGDGRRDLDRLAARLDAAAMSRLQRLSDRLEALDRTRTTLGYTETLKRGYAVVRGDGAVVTTRAAAEKALSLEVEFQDGRVTLGSRMAKKVKGEREGGQGSLF